MPIQFSNLHHQTPSGASVRDMAERAVEGARMPYMQTRYIIGIDPGVQCGFAVWNRSIRQFDVIETLSFWEVMERVQAYNAPETKLIVEVAHHAPTFRHLKAEGGNAHTLSKIARNVGQVTREAQLLVEGLKRLGYAVAEVKPAGKKDQAEFKRITGWAKRTNQHERDAALMAFQT